MKFVDKHESVQLVLSIKESSGEYRHVLYFLFICINILHDNNKTDLDLLLIELQVVGMRVALGNRLWNKKNRISLGGFSKWNNNNLCFKIFNIFHLTSAQSGVQWINHLFKQYSIAVILFNPDDALIMRNI